MKTLKVGPETARMLELGHPWIISDRFTRQWPAIRNGELATLTDMQGKRLATALLEPGARIIARVLELGPMLLNPEWLQEKISAARELRERHADLSNTTVYRILNGEGDGLPGVTVDRFGDHLLLQLYCASWKPHLPLLSGALKKLFSPDSLTWKFRPQETRRLAGDKKGKDHLGHLLEGELPQGKYAVVENGLNFLVDLKGGLHTGIFMDQRRNREDLMLRAKGRSFLNLFAYTGAFSVAAAAAGARQTVSVDASGTYLDWARENFEANRIDPRRHEFIAGDCFQVLADFKREKRRFELILMDPPSFSTTSKSRFTTRQGTAELVTSALDLLSSGGLLITSSNHQKVDLADYLKELRRGALQAGCALRVIKTAGQAEDFPYPVTFPEGRYLKYVIAVKE